jgi:hypothetical protein
MYPPGFSLMHSGTPAPLKIGEILGEIFTSSKRPRD